MQRFGIELGRVMTLKSMFSFRILLSILIHSFIDNIIAASSSFLKHACLNHDAATTVWDGLCFLFLFLI